MKLYLLSVYQPDGPPPPPETPHLHFAVFKLGPEKHWWEGTPIDPYAIWR